MAESESDEEEFSEDGEEGGEHDGSSSQDGKQKKQLMIIAGLVVGIIVLVVAVYLFRSEPEDKGAEEDQDDRGKVVLTGHGKIIAGKIPDLPVIPYSGKSEKKGKGAGEGGQDGKKKDDGKSIRLANGEVIYTIGDPEQVGEKQTAAGVVVVDRVNVQKGENGEKLIQARVQNQGSRYLADSHVDIIFLDSRNRPVLVRGVNPLVISGGLFGDKIQTLAPGSSRIFMVDATDVPDKWSGSVSAEVGSYHFAP